MSHWRLHPELPIFGVEKGDVAAVYMPGHVMPVPHERLHQLHAIWAENALYGERQCQDTARQLVSVATGVKESWSRLHREDFSPVCLNLMLPYSCGLSCGYCYARPRVSRESEVLNRAAATAAARLVAANCARLGVPFQMDIQGAGEPTCLWDDLQWCVEMAKAEARGAQVAWSSHLSTNGQVDAAQAGWIGRTFSHVTLSCDGPPDIQDACRPRRDGGSSSAGLAAAAAKLSLGKAALDARVTVTATNNHRLNEVIQYIAASLGIRSIRLEPAFAPVSAGDIVSDPEVAAASCLRACETGRQQGIEVTLASPHLTELHGAYCQALRGILRIMPDGKAANCIHGVCQELEYAAVIGRHDAATGAYLLDREGIGRLRRQAEHIPMACRDCLNVFHCSRCCPDRCRLPDVPATHWRCRFQKFVAEYWIMALARQASDVSQSGDAGVEFNSQLEAEIRELPDPLVRDEILANTRLAAERYPLERAHMPTPAWADERCLRQIADPTEALMTSMADRSGDISVYVHLPFCRTRCVFCDCHSVAATLDHDERFAAYVERLKRDLGVWCERGRIGRRHVSTVHFGGGTPVTIGEGRFAEIVAALGDQLNVNSQTQWAVETTSACATERHVDWLMRLGFRRLHVGVQTLNDNLRSKLGRTCHSSEVVERLGAAMKAGMVTSVDMLYGLPEQTVGMLLEDLSRLVAAGLHGFSLYRLNLSSRNQGMLRLFPGCQPLSLRSCIMLQAAESLLLRGGYRKNHCAHYALPPDDNRYYRHAVRNEDMLGLGASASGVVGEWEYRCSHYPQYLDGGQGSLPIALLACNPSGAQLRLIETSLMTGRIPTAAVSIQVSIARLLQSWVRSGLLAPEEGGLRLTATGTWMSGGMLDELKGSCIVDPTR